MGYEVFVVVLNVFDYVECWLNDDDEVCVIKYVDVLKLGYLYWSVFGGGLVVNFEVENCCYYDEEVECYKLKDEIVNDEIFV